MSKLVDPNDLATIKTAAEKLGVPRTNVNAWSRGKTFPKQVADLGGVRVYLQSEIDAWCEKRFADT